MGQAKQRGTLEERKALALRRDAELRVKKEAERAEKLRQEREAYEALPEATKRRLKEQKQLLATIIGLYVDNYEKLRV